MNNVMDAVSKMKADVKGFVMEKRRSFEQLAKEYRANDVKDASKYSILNYTKIMNETVEYVQGFFDYVRDGKTEYLSKVLGLTLEHYGKMTTDPKYRVVMDLKSMEPMNVTYLEKTKALLDLCDQMAKYADDPVNEVPYTTKKVVSEMIALTDNHFRRVSKIHSDDTDIRLWLLSRHNKYLKSDISSRQMADFMDKATPVMHSA